MSEKVKKSHQNIGNLLMTFPLNLDFFAAYRTGLSRKNVQQNQNVPSHIYTCTVFRIFGTQWPPFCKSFELQTPSETVSGVGLLRPSTVSEDIWSNREWWLKLPLVLWMEEIGRRFIPLESNLQRFMVANTDWYRISSSVIRSIL